MDKVNFPYRSDSHLPFLHVVHDSGSWAKHGLDVNYDYEITSEDSHKNVANGTRRIRRRQSSFALHSPFDGRQMGLPRPNREFVESSAGRARRLGHQQSFRSQRQKSCHQRQASRA